MPAPIGLVSQQSTWDCLKGDNNYSLSDIQRELMNMDGVKPPVREASKYDPRTVLALELIFKNEADDLTTLAEAVGHPKHMYRVPSQVSDWDLLSLKTAGLVLGHGRAVNITEKGTEALRMHWLNSTNSRKTDKQFQHPAARQAADAGNVRTASKRRCFAGEEAAPRQFARDE